VKTWHYTCITYITLSDDDVDDAADNSDEIKDIPRVTEIILQTINTHITATRSASFEIF